MGHCSATTKSTGLGQLMILEQLISNLEPISPQTMTPFGHLDLAAIDRTQTRKRSKQLSGAPKRSINYHKLASMTSVRPEKEKEIEKEISFGGIPNNRNICAAVSCA